MHGHSLAELCDHRRAQICFRLQILLLHLSALQKLPELVIADLKGFRYHVSPCEDAKRPLRFAKITE
jgi:hypothetical protein